MIVYNILCKQKSQEKSKKKYRKKETPRCKIKLAQPITKGISYE